MKKKTIREAEVSTKKVICRMDFNVPMKDGKITDDTRIKGALPTIKYLIENNAKIILMSHLGRPKGIGIEEKFKLDAVGTRLSELLDQNVKKLDDCIGEKVKSEIAKMNDKDIILLENLRFYKEEKKGEENFTKELASLADIFVLDAFGTAHRAHASVSGVAKYLPCYSGFLMEKEIKAFDIILNAPKNPYVAILGGAKVSDKIGVIENLLNKADKILIGGAMAFTFFKSEGYEVGRSLFEEDKLNIAFELVEKAKSLGKEIVLPVDFIVADNIDENVETELVEFDKIPENKMGLDIGPASVSLFKEHLKDAKTVVWNGPMGVFEIDKFSKGTIDIANLVAELEGKATTVIGGGDSVAAVHKFNLADKMTHISTGGGASLELLEGKKLPGIESIQNI